MAEPIVRTFVIDTTKAEQNLQSLDAATTATTVALDALYNQLFQLDELLGKLSPNSQAFNEVNTQIQALESTITQLETGKIEDIGTAIGNISVGNAVSEIESVGAALDTISPDAAVTAISEVEQAINSIDTSDATGKIAEIDAAINDINPDAAVNAISEIDAILSTINPDDTISAINAVNTAINEVDASGITGEIASIETSLESIDTTQVVTNIESINDAASSIDISNVATDIDSINTALGSIDTTQAVTSISEIETSLNAIDATNAVGNIESIDTALTGIDTANVVTDIDNINSALSSIDASAAVAQVESVNSALDAVDTSNVTGQIENINSELASVDVSTAINEIAAINEEFSKIDTTNVISEILGIGDSVNQIDTSGVVDQIAAINTELNSIDATNVTADVSEISTAIESIDASNAVTEISSIDSALSGIDTGQIVGEINNIGDAVADINTDNITDVGNAVNNAAAPVENLAASTAKLNDELKDTKVDSSSINNATANFKEFGNTEKAVGESTKSLKAQLRELQKQLAETDPQTEKYRELSQEAGILKDKVQDAAQAVGSQAGGAFERVGGSLGLVTSRIASLDFEGAAEGAKLLAQNIGSIKPGDIANGVKGIGTAFASIGKALLTNPIFLIGGAIAAAIAYSEELLSLVDGVSSAEEERLAAQKESAALSKQQLDAIGEQENLLRLQGKSEKEILQLKIAAAQQAIIDQKAVIETLKIQKQAQVDAAKRNADITKGILQFLTAPLQLLAGAVDYIILGLNKVGVISDETFASIGSLRESFNESVTGLLFDPTQVAADGDKTIAEAEKTLKQLENTQAGFQLSINQINQKAADDRQKTRDEELAAEQKLADDIYNTRKKNAELLAGITAQIRKDSAKPVESTKTPLTNFDAELKAQQDAQDLAISLMAEGQDKEIALVDAKYAKLREQAKGNAELQKQIADANQAEVNAIIQKGVDQEVATRQAGFKKGLELAGSAIQVLQAFSDASTKNGERDARKKFKTDKALAIGAATVQTASAVTGALTAGGNPIKLATGQQFVEASIAAALGLAQIIKIKNSQFGGGGTGGNDTNVSTPSVADTGGGAQPAQFNPLAAQFLQDRPEQLTPRAYVLSGDVASQQEVRQKVEDLSRIG